MTPPALPAAAHRWPLVFDRASFDDPVGALGHTLSRRWRYPWSPNQAACHLVVPTQVMSRPFSPDHELACPACREVVLAAAVTP